MCAVELQLGQYQDVLLVELDGPRQQGVVAVAFGLKRQVISRISIAAECWLLPMRRSDNHQR